MAQHGLDVAVLLVGSVAQGDFQRRVALLARHRNAHRNVPKALANRNLDRFVRPLRNVFDERRRTLLGEQQRMDEIFALQFQTLELRLHVPHDGVDRSERAGVGLLEHASWLPGKTSKREVRPTPVRKKPHVALGCFSSNRLGTFLPQANEHESNRNAHRSCRLWQKPHDVCASSSPGQAAGMQKPRSLEFRRSYFAPLHLPARKHR